MFSAHAVAPLETQQNRVITTLSSLTTLILASDNVTLSAQDWQLLAESVVGEDYATLELASGSESQTIGLMATRGSGETVYMAINNLGEELAVSFVDGTSQILAPMSFLISFNYFPENISIAEAFGTFTLNGQKSHFLISLDTLKSNVALPGYTYLLNPKTLQIEQIGLEVEGVEAVTGSVGDDTFRVEALRNDKPIIGSIACIDGEAGRDKIIGPNQNTVWEINAENKGNISSENETLLMCFSNIETLVGGSKTDTFSFATGGDLIDIINVGGGDDSLVTSVKGTDNSKNYITLAAGSLVTLDGGLLNQNIVTQSGEVINSSTLTLADITSGGVVVNDVMFNNVEEPLIVDNSKKPQEKNEPSTTTTSGGAIGSFWVFTLILFYFRRRDVF
ncbi:hypothetical protein CW745_04485 [Psychromonas sp. psych-6C06]|nr:hypothetical protein CW745_04485 [Psychromonas sp. psych-6C06]